MGLPGHHDLNATHLKSPGNIISSQHKQFKTGGRDDDADVETSRHINKRHRHRHHHNNNNDNNNNHNPKQKDVFTSW